MLLAVSTPATAAQPDSIKVSQGPTTPDRARHPLAIKIRGYSKSGTPLLTSTTPYGYSPSQIANVLGLSADGAGQTIAIVDAFDDPTVLSDIDTFSTQYGLPRPCSLVPAGTACFNFNNPKPQGTPTFDAGWALEISLDVQWAHAVAPRANILLVEAKDNYFSSLMSAIDYAAANGASVISNSYGGSEFSSETYYDSHCALTGAVCTFSTGDSGNPGSYPAYNPYGLAIGGTHLVLDSAGNITSTESAWSGSGGGLAKYEKVPTYQSAVNPYATRGTPDVSFVADPATGMSVFDSAGYNGQTGWFRVGGTSASAPMWAGIIAVANQLRGTAFSSANYEIHSKLYALSSGLFDVTTGTNGTCGAVCTTSSGYDFVTGLGSPRRGIDVALSTASPPPPPPPPSDVPGAPQNLVASKAPKGATGIRLSWVAPASGTVAGYRVYRSTSASGTRTLIASSSSTSYADTATNSNGLYYYWVSAYNASSIEGPLSNSASARAR